MTRDEVLAMRDPRLKRAVEASARAAKRYQTARAAVQRTCKHPVVVHKDAYDGMLFYHHAHRTCVRCGAWEEAYFGTFKKLAKSAVLTAASCDPVSIRA